MAVQECRQVRAAARPASLLHRLLCRECRRALAVDRAVWLAMACRRAAAPRAAGMASTLEALGLDPRSIHAARLRARRAAKAWRRRAAAVAGAVVLSVGGWLWHLDRDPFAASGFAVERSAAVGSPQAVSSAFTLLTTAAQTTVKPDRVRAAVTALETGKRIPERADAAPSGVEAAPADANATSWEEVSDLLTANAEVLAGARKALALPFSVSAPDPGQSEFGGADMRRLGELMALNARFEARRGRYAAAMQSALEAMELGAEIQNGTGTIGRLVGVYVKAKGRRAAWDLVGRIDAPMAEQAVRRIERIAVRTPPLSAALATEQAIGMTLLARMFREPRARWLTLVGGWGDTGGLSAYLAVLRYSKAEIVRNYMKGMAAARVLADAPYQTYGLSTGWGPEAASGDPVSQMMLFDVSSMRLRDADDRAMQGLLQCALALRAYHVAHRAYPASLTTLAGKYLTEVPSDPFFGGSARAFRYRGGGSEYTLYSIGPDGVDDGGEPLASGDQSSGVPEYRALDPTSRGDIVVGLRRS